MSQTPKSPAYAPLKTSRTKEAPTAWARPMAATGSQSTSTPNGIGTSRLSSAITDAMTAVTSGPATVRYGRSPSLQNMTASTPLAARISRSRATASRSPRTPRLWSYSGCPGIAGKCAMAMIAFGLPNRSSIAVMRSLR